MHQIAVIIPTYNRSQLLSRAIESVLSQSFLAQEIIVIDDGSVDGTYEFVQKHYPQVQIHRTDNRGVSAARNLGIEIANSEWLAFLDSDDEWLASKLKRQIDLLQKKPELKIVHGEEIWIRKGKRVNQMKKHQKYGGMIYQKCLPLCLISPSAVMIHRDVFNDVGNFREDFPVCEDYDLWLRITSRYPVGFVSEPIINKYGGHEDQLSQKLKAMDYYRILSLHDRLKSGCLNTDDFQATKKVLEQKANILIHGYQKHGHQDKAQIIQQLLESEA